MKDHEEEIKFLTQEEEQNVKTNAPKRVLQRLRIICLKRNKLVRSKLVITMAFLVLFQLGHHYFRIVKRYNRHSYYIHYRKKYDRCKFQDNGPEPVILMALGRSGSSVTWDTLARLSGDATIAHEITGGNQEASLDYFNDIKDHINEKWASLRLCNIQRYYMDKSKNDGKNYAMVGFQWKPYKKTFDHHYANDGLRRLADDRSKVIYLTRNPLDRYISNRKHSQFIHSEEVPAHCKADDTDCIKRHKLHAKGIQIDLQTDEEKLAFINHLRKGIQADELIENKLDFVGVKHVHVRYESLFNDDDDDTYADEWMKVFHFLGVGPQEELTMGDVRRSFEYASTSATQHNKTIANYKKVKEALEGTDFWNLIH